MSNRRKLVAIVLAYCISSNVSASSETFSFKKGKLVYSQDFNDGNRKLWTGGKIHDGKLSLATPANAGHGATARLSMVSDWTAYQTPEKRTQAKQLVPNDITNSIIEFDFKFVKGSRFNIVIDDVYSKTYTHAGHVCRAQIGTKFFKIEDDIRGQFGLRQIEKTQTKEMFEKVKRSHYPVKNIVVHEKHSLDMHKWYSVRLVMLDTKMALYLGEKGDEPKLLGVLDSAGKVEGFLPQPTVAHGAEINREDQQPRGLGHFKSKWGFTTPQEGETLFDNIRIYAVTPR
ncbi:hypothetical protein [Paraglaciecola sp.]|uniref:hypothetical protein n=1 Tax=Paraglaciecola sp. TaxID=1920173 RepID=UPI003EF0EE46